MAENSLKSKIESLLLVAGEPLSIGEISKALKSNAAQVEKDLTALTQEYKLRGIRIVKKQEHYLLGTAPEHTSLVSEFLNEELRSELSAASLEVLAIIIYKQPITRAEIEEVRGADSARNIRILMVRGLIEERGRKEAPGRPIIYGTTVKLLTYFGLQSEEELPKVKLSFELKS